VYHSPAQTNDVFKCLLKSCRLSFRSGTGRKFQKQGPANVKLLSPSHVHYTVLVVTSLYADCYDGL